MDDLSFLVEETFSNVKEMSGSLSSSNEKGPGLIFHLDAYPSVFVIRSLAVLDLGESLKNCREFPENYPSLNLNHENLDRLAFFKTTSMGAAQKLNKITAHRRFPVSEELLCSFSDPCFSYWLEKTVKGFVISTKMPTSEIKKLVRLGDFGDFTSFKLLMNELLIILQMAPGNWKIFAQDHRIYFEGNQDNFLWKLIVDYFENGNFSDEFHESLKFLSSRLQRGKDIEGFISSMKDLSTLRIFWKEIFSQLNEGGSSKATLAM